MSRRIPRPTSRTSATDSGARASGEEGAGLIAAVAGVTVFLALLLVATQLLFNLYATSVVNAVGFDAARVVAGSGGRAPSAREEAERRARELLGRYGERVRFDWSASDDDNVVVRVQADNPSMLVREWAGSLGFDTIDRTIRVRVERLR